MSLGMNFLLAFCAGCVGSVIGGLQSFVMYGFIGLFVAAMGACGADTSFLGNVFMNLFFLPAVMFNGAATAASYTGRKYAEFPGENIAKGLGHYSDPMILLVGGIGGVIGYAIYYGLNCIGFPADTGAWSMVLFGIAGRLFFKGQICDRGALYYITSGDILGNLWGWAYPVFMALVVAIAATFFINEVQIWNIGFVVSAASMLYSFVDPSFPATHHITLVVGYTLQCTGNLLFAVVMGVIAQIIAILFEMVFNTRCGTHIDPPGVAIALCSLFLFAIF